MKTLRIRFHRPLILVLAALVLAALWLGKAPAHAQANTNPPLPNGCPCVSQAIELLAKANVPVTSLKEIIPLVAEPQKLTDKLTAAKVDPKAASDLVAALQDLVHKDGLTSGALEVYSVSHALDILDKYKLPSDLLGPIVAATTADDARKVLEKYQVDVDALLKELQPYKDLALDATAIRNYWVSASIAVLEQYDVQAMRAGYALKGAVLLKGLPSYNDLAALKFFNPFKVIKTVFSAIGDVTKTVAGAAKTAAETIAEKAPQLANVADKIVQETKPLVKALELVPIPQVQGVARTLDTVGNVVSAVDGLIGQNITDTAEKAGIAVDKISEFATDIANGKVDEALQMIPDSIKADNPDLQQQIQSEADDVDTPDDAQQIVSDVTSDEQATATEIDQPIVDTSATDTQELTTDASQPESEPVIVDDNQSGDNGGQ